MPFVIPLVIVATIIAFIALISIIAGPARPLSEAEANQLR